METVWYSGCGRVEIAFESEDEVITFGCGGDKTPLASGYVAKYGDQLDKHDLNYLRDILISYGLDENDGDIDTKEDIYGYLIWIAAGDLYDAPELDEDEE